MDTIGDRIRRIRKGLGLNQLDFAIKIGLESAMAISKYENNSRTPDKNRLIKISELGGVTLDKLMTGTEPTDKVKNMTMSSPDLAIENHVDICKQVGVYALAGAGAPTDLVATSPLENIAIPTSFYKPSIITIKVRGKSMEPLIRDGAYIGIDRDERWIVSGEIYAVWLPYEGAVIKRLYMDMEKIILKSDNTQFPDISVLLQGISEGFIQGRVKWVIQML